MTGQLSSSSYPMTDGDFRRISEILKNEAGISLSESKKQLVSSRLSKRLRFLGLASFKEYCEALTSAQTAAEMRNFIKALTTNVTSFFREPHHFEYLRAHLLPRLADRASKGAPVRIWSAGCSGGQEPYTIAMVVREVIPRVHDLDVKILATDIDGEMLERARRGVYKESETENIPQEMLDKNFVNREGSDWEVVGSTKKLITFRELNLFKEWPMRRRFDVIFCRNVVIYFDVEDQISLWQRFASQLVSEGHLFIGHSERISGPMTAQFRSRGLTINQLDAEFTLASSMRATV